MGTVEVLAVLSLDPLAVGLIVSPALVAVVIGIRAARRRRGEDVADDDDDGGGNVHAIEDARSTREARGSESSPRWR